MRNMLPFVATWVMLAIAGDVFAHPGHGVSAADPSSPIHYLIEPVHGLVVVSVLVVVGGAIVLIKKLAGQRSR
jgi:hypothetical protein